ncbi:MAG: hypothetical protein K1X53_16865 [Candidatus Sumerlaeaceae bacterium]|nr:hypothetical protein [Candidatus Sumerlaeaceae bacterium]
MGNSWTKWAVAGSNTITYGQASVNKYEGSYSQYFARADTATFDGGVYQRIAVNPGTQYQVVAQMKRQSVLSGTTMQFGYDLTGGTSGAAASVSYTDITGSVDNVWAGYSATVTATGGFITLFARGGHTGSAGGTNSYFYLDAVSLNSTN